MDNEIWIDVKGWDGKYLISNYGRLKSIDGKYSKIHPEGYITKGHKDTQGYKGATLRKPGTCFKTRIHVLVAEHFCEKPDGSECVNHKDGNKHNNAASNLEWDTLAGNVGHAVETGLMDFKGEKHPQVKVSEEDVIDMRRMRRAGITHEQIGRIFGICRRQAGDVINGINWGWLRYGL